MFVLFVGIVEVCCFWDGEVCEFVCYVMGVVYWMVVEDDVCVDFCVDGDDEGV